MKILICLLALSVLVSTDAQALDRKYGMFAASDAMLGEILNDADTSAVIFGRVYKCEKIHHIWYSHVKVLECYKGNFKPGDQLFVFIEAESGPDPAKEIGARKFFILHQVNYRLNYGETIDMDVMGKFTCDPQETVDYADYGETLHQALLKARK